MGIESPIGFLAGFGKVVPGLNFREICQRAPSFHTGKWTLEEAT
jgi:hypothetical protein